MKGSTRSSSLKKQGLQESSRQRPKEINFVIGIGIFAITALPLYWITWFTAPQLIQGRTPDAPDYEIYVHFEQAFPLADGFIVAAALIGVIGLWRMKFWGYLWMLLAAGAAIFLGLMDLLFDLQYDMFVPLTAETAIELVIVLITLSLGHLLILPVGRLIDQQHLGVTAQHGGDAQPALEPGAERKGLDLAEIFEA